MLTTAGPRLPHDHPRGYNRRLRTSPLHSRGPITVASHQGRARRVRCVPGCIADHRAITMQLSPDFAPPSTTPTPLSATLTDATDNTPTTNTTTASSPGQHRDGGELSRSKPKQKRNKPTLSCLECGACLPSVSCAILPPTKPRQSRGRQNAIESGHALLVSNGSPTANIRPWRT